MAFGCAFSGTSWRAVESIQAHQVSVVLLSRLGVPSLRNVEPIASDQLLAELRKEDVFTGLLVDGGLVITTRSAVPSKEAAAGLHLLAFSAPVIRKGKRGAHATAQLIGSPILLSPERVFATNEALGVTIVACNDLSSRKQEASVACKVSSLSRSLDSSLDAFLLIYCFAPSSLARGKAVKSPAKSDPSTALSWRLKKGRVLGFENINLSTDPDDPRRMTIQMPRSRSLLSSKNAKASSQSGRQHDLMVPSCVMFNGDGGIGFIVDHGTMSKAQVRATPINVILEWISSMYEMTDTSITLPPNGIRNKGSSTSEHILPEAAGDEDLNARVDQLTNLDSGPNQDATTEPIPDPLPSNMDTCMEHGHDGILGQAGSRQQGCAISASEAVEASLSTDQVQESAEKQKLSPEELKARIMGYGNTSTLMKRQHARAEVSRNVAFSKRVTDVSAVADGAKSTTSSSLTAEGRGSEGGLTGVKGSISRTPALWRFGSTGQQQVAATTTPDGTAEGIPQNTALNNLPFLQMIVAAPVAAFVGLGSKMNGAMVEFESAFKKNQGNGEQLVKKKESDKKKLQEQEVRRHDAYKNAAASLFNTTHHLDSSPTPNLQILPPDEERSGDVSHLQQAVVIKAGEAKGSERHASGEAGCDVMAGVKQGDEKDGDEASDGKEASETSGDRGKLSGTDGDEANEMGSDAGACDRLTALSGSLSMDSSKELKADHSSEIVVGARSSDRSSKSSEHSSHRHSRDSSSSTEHAKAKEPPTTQTSIDSIAFSTRRPRVLLEDHWWKTELVGEEPGRRLVAAQLAREAMLMRGGSGKVARMKGRVGGLEALTPLPSRSNSGVPLAIRNGAITEYLPEEGSDSAEGSNAGGSKAEGGRAEGPDGADAVLQGLAQKRATGPAGDAADGACAGMDKPLEPVRSDDGSALQGSQENQLLGKGSAAKMLGKVEGTLPSTANQAGMEAHHQQSCQNATADQDLRASKAEHEAPVKAVPPPVDRRLESGFDGLMQAVESLATMSVSRSPGAKPWASSNRRTDKGMASQSMQHSSPVLACDGAVSSQGKRYTEPRQAAAGVASQPAMSPPTPHSSNLHGPSTGHRLPAASLEHTEEFAHRAGVLSLQQQAAWLWGSAQHMAARGTRASSATSDGDAQARDNGTGSDRMSGWGSDRASGLSGILSARTSSSVRNSAGGVEARSWSQQGGKSPVPVADLVFGKRAYEYLKEHQKECGHMGPRTPH
ncbi:hypothetical protein CLOM_g7604 [Closterium sp. NIES-68]|nr:hypothetical protein CLOM_g7604 [Closterium sp. NIES-68]